jgi:NADH-quinone oxidoreductase subunit E
MAGPPAERPGATRDVNQARHDPPELTAGEQHELQAERERVPSARAAGIEGLKIVQRHRGWVTDAGLAALAAALELPAAELESVATFYNLIHRRPVGRHVILLCDSVSCWVLGQESLQAALEDHLGIRAGETTPDGRFTLLPMACLGCCDRAPAMMIDDDLHHGLAPDGLAAILERYE